MLSEIRRIATISPMATAVVAALGLSLVLALIVIPVSSQTASAPPVDAGDAAANPVGNQAAAGTDHAPAVSVPAPDASRLDERRFRQSDTANQHSSSTARLVSLPSIELDGEGDESSLTPTPTVTAGAGP